MTFDVKCGTASVRPRMSLLKFLGSRGSHCGASGYMVGESGDGGEEGGGRRGESGRGGRGDRGEPSDWRSRVRKEPGDELNKKKKAC